MVSPKASGGTAWETRDARDHLGSTGRALGTDRTYHPGGRPAQSPGPQALCPTTDAQRHHLPAAQRVPMEPIAERAWGRQHHSSHLSTVGRDGRLAPNVGSPGGGVRRVGWRGLGMAGGRRSHGQGTFWGDLIGPTLRTVQGWYQAQSPCGWRGRPLEHCGCGSKRARCQAVGGDPGRHCGRTTTAHRGGTPTPVSGQRV